MNPTNEELNAFQDADSNGSAGQIEFTIFLMDRIGISITLDTNKRVTTQEILNRLYEELPSQWKDIEYLDKFKMFFALWMTSPLLELQLNSLHRPFNLLANWDQFLLKYSAIDIHKDMELIQKDEAILSFQRSIFAKIEDEINLDQDQIEILKLLYEEARLNFLDGRYPLKEFEELAAYQAAIEFNQTRDGRLTDYETFREKINDFIPHQHRKKETGILNLFTTSASNKISQSVFKKFNKIIENQATEYKLIRNYMEKCWQMPLYGSAFFNGQIERPVKGIATILDHFDIPVWIGINRQGIHVIDKKTSELFFSASFNQLQWRVAEVDPDKNSECFSCLFIKFDNDSESKILQIFTRQTTMIESLINSFAKEQAAEVKEDVVDGSTCMCKNNRLSLKSC